MPSRSNQGRAYGILLAAILAHLTTLSVQITSGQPMPMPGTANAFFGLTNVWTVHLRVSPEDWSAMEQSAPAIRRRGPAGPAVVPDVRPLGPAPQPGPANGPLVDRFLGFTRDKLNYVAASVEIAGHKFEQIGLRLKGHSSLMSSRGSLKRPFKIDFNHFVKGQKFLGLSKINLNNNAMDPTQIHEALAYDIFRAAGVPSSRTAFAKVFLSVPGLYERQYLGLYTVVEQVDGNFLKDRFGSDQGLLVKPELPAGLRYLGEDWSAYRKPYEAKNEPKPEEAQRFIEFIKLLTSGDETAFRSRLAEFMEVDQFLCFLAVTVAVADTDSVLGLGHNFYLFQRAPTQRTVWIPWDLNLSLGSSSGRREMELSVRKPAPPQNRLVTWLLQDAHWSAVYRAHLQSILNSAFQPDRILRQVEQLRAVLRSPIALESPTSLARFENAVAGGRTNTASPVNLAGPPSASRFYQAPFPPDAAWTGSVPLSLPLTKWLTGRADSIAAQLAGRSEGTRTVWPMGH